MPVLMFVCCIKTYILVGIPFSFLRQYAPDAFCGHVNNRICYVTLCNSTVQQWRAV